MKSCLALLSAAACCAVAANAAETSVNPATGTIPDWSVLAAAGAKCTIYADETWVLHEADLDNAAKVPYLYVDGTLILSNVTHFARNANGKTMENWFSSSSGTFIKRGSSTLSTEGTWNYALNQATLRVEEGTFLLADHYGFNGNALARRTTVIVSPGATLRATSKDAIWTGMKIHLAGTGVDGAGAFVIDNAPAYEGTYLGYLELDDDATLALNKDGIPLFGAYKHKYGASPDVDYSELVLNGHVLTLAGTAAKTTFGELATSGGGRLVFSPLASGAARTLALAKTADLSGLGALEMPAGGQLTLAGTVPPQSCALVANGDLTLGATSARDATTANACTWTGAISVPADATLVVDPANANYALGVSGAISGAGGVSFGTSAKKATGTVFFSGANAYTGGTALNGDTSFKVFVETASSIPDFENMTCAGGCVAPSVKKDGEGEATWTNAEILQFAKACNATSLAVDASALDSASDLVFSSALVAQYFPSLALAWDSYGTTGGFTLTGPYAADKPLALAQTGGTIRLAGDDEIALGASMLASVSSAAPATLVVDGATVKHGDALVAVGNQNGDVATYGKIVVKNGGQWLSTHVGKVSTDQAGLETNAIYLGYKWGHGELDVLAGGVVSNKVMAGGGKYVNGGSGTGSIFVEDGAKLYFGDYNNGGANYVNSGVGLTVYGYLQQTGGEIGGYDLVVGSYNKGVYHAYGGTVELTHNFNVGAANCGHGLVYLSNVVVRCVKGYVQMCQTHSGMGTAALTIDAGANVEMTNDVIYANSKTDAKSSVINLLHGGRIAARGARVFSSDADSAGTAAAYTNRFLLGFDGGVFAATRNTPLFHGWWQPGCSASNGFSRVLVYKDGATLDSNGYTCDMTAARPLEGIVAGGIQSIELGEPVEGLIGAPHVAISGAGYGAAAVADWDPEKRVLKGVRVTGHGWGYVQGEVTVTLSTGSGARGWTKTLSGDAITVGDNEIGGFTKAGEGTITFAAANTWQKWTRLAGGTLKIAAAQAIPAGTELQLAGGALDLNNVEGVTFMDISGASGTVKNGAVKLAGPAWTLSAKRFVNREATVLAGTLDLTDVSSLEFADAEALETQETKKLPSLVLVKATEIKLPASGVSLAAVPAGWYAELTNESLRFGRIHGAALIIR